MRGRLRSFDEVRGYGFITPDDGGPDVYVHVKAIRKIGIVPEIGMRLRFKEWSMEDGRRRVGRLYPTKHDGE